MGCSESKVHSEENTDPKAIWESQKASKKELQRILSDAKTSANLWSGVHNVLLKVCSTEAQSNVKRLVANRRDVLQKFQHHVSKYMQRVDEVIKLARKTCKHPTHKDALQVQYRLLMIEKSSHLNAGLHDVLLGDQELCRTFNSIADAQFMAKLATTIGTSSPQSSGGSSFPNDSKAGVSQLGTKSSLDEWNAGIRKSLESETSQFVETVTALQQSLAAYFDQRSAVAKSLQKWSIQRNMPILSEFSGTCEAMSNKVRTEESFMVFEKALKERAEMLREFSDRVEQVLTGRRMISTNVEKLRIALKKESKLLGSIPDLKDSVQMLSDWVSCLESVRSFSRFDDLALYRPVFARSQELLKSSKSGKSTPFGTDSSIFQAAVQSLLSITDKFHEWNQGALAKEQHGADIAAFDKARAVYAEYKSTASAQARVLLLKLDQYVKSSSQALENDDDAELIGLPPVTSTFSTTTTTTSSNSSSSSSSSSPESSVSKPASSADAKEKEKERKKKREAFRTTFQEYEELIRQWRLKREDLEKVRAVLDANNRTVEAYGPRMAVVEKAFPTLCESVARTVLQPLVEMRDAFCLFQDALHKISSFYESDRTIVLVKMDDFAVQHVEIRNLEADLDGRVDAAWSSSFATLEGQVDLLFGKYGTGIFKEMWTATRAFMSQRVSTRAERDAVFETASTVADRNVQLVTERDQIESKSQNMLANARASLSASLCKMFAHFDTEVLASMLQQNSTALSDSQKLLKSFGSTKNASLSEDVNSSCGDDDDDDDDGGDGDGDDDNRNSKKASDAEELPESADQGRSNAVTKPASSTKPKKAW
eukprot:ANDGO_04989.mRNA.1 hypothetical protein